MSKTEGTLRLADFLEAIPAEGWICCSCTFDAAVLPLEQALRNLRDGYADLLAKYPQLRLKLVKIDGLLYWKFATEAECAFDNLVEVVPSIDNSIPATFPLDVAPVWRLRLCRREAESKTEVRVLASHAICSGRTLCDIFELFLHVATKEPLPPDFVDAQHQPLLPSFGKKDWFVDQVSSHIHPPRSWERLVPYKMNPAVALPSHVVCLHWRHRYAPVSAFCRRHGVTVQGVLMAIQERGYRAFHQGAIDAMPLAAYVPVDVRRSQYASARGRRSALFFPNSGVVVVFVEKQRDILGDVRHCQERLRAALATDEAPLAALTQANILDERTHQVAFPAHFPNASVHNIIFASHLGRVCPTRHDVLFGSSSPVAAFGYWPNLYAYHTDEELYFMFTPPYNVVPSFVAMVRDSIAEMMEFIERDGC